MPSENTSPGPESGLLGRGELIRRLRNDDLVITPLLSPKQIGAASVDLRMGNVVLIVRARGTSHVDPRQQKRITMESKQRGEGDLSTAFERALAMQQKHERYEIPFGSPFLLHPGSLALVPTLEWIMLPSDLHGSVTARSTWAREGLNIATATFIEPNYHGIVTLELANLGEIPISLFPGMRIAQIAFVKTMGKTEREKDNDSQFKMSFEPKQGDIAPEDDFPFIPDAPQTARP